MRYSSSLQFGQALREAERLECKTYQAGPRAFARRSLFPIGKSKHLDIDIAGTDSAAGKTRIL